jgi:miniconductance mechanosensitive channel
VEFATPEFLDTITQNELAKRALEGVELKSAEGATLTNLDLFMRSVNSYIAHHPRTNSKMISMVRQLQPTEWGLPIEIYCFSANVNWIPYEHLQADIISYIVALAPIFKLRIYQAPSGLDIRKS